MNHEERKAAVRELSRTPDLLQQLILDVDEARLDAAVPGEWPVRTVVAHLLSDEWQVFRLRLERMLSEDHPTVTPFDPKLWQAYYQAQPLELCSKIVTDFTVQRQASIRLLENMNESDWGRGAYHPEHGEITIDWMVDYWLKHDQDHLNQITKLLEE